MKTMTMKTLAAAILANCALSAPASAALVSATPGNIIMVGCTTPTKGSTFTSKVFSLDVTSETGDTIQTPAALDQDCGATMNALREAQCAATVASSHWVLVGQDTVVIPTTNYSLQQFTLACTQEGKN